MKDLENKTIVCPECEGTKITRTKQSDSIYIIGFISLMSSLFVPFLFIITIPITIICFIAAPRYKNQFFYSCLECNHLWESKKTTNKSVGPNESKKPDKPKKTYKRRKPSKYKLNKKDDNPML